MTRRFHTAVMRGDINAVRKIVQSGKSLNYDLALTDAVSHGQVEMVEYLLKYTGADPMSGLHPIVIATKEGHIDVVELLLNITYVPFHNYREIMQTSVADGRTDTVQLLLQRPYSDHVSDVMHHFRLFSIVAENNDVSMLELLMSDDRLDPSMHGNEALHISLDRRNVEIAAILLRDPRVVPTFDDLIQVILDDNTTIAHLIVERGVDPSGNDNEALRRAIEHEKFWAIHFLLKDPRVDPSTHGLILFVIEYGNVRLLRELLNDSRVDPAADDNLLVRSAAASGHENVVKELIADPRVDPTALNYETVRTASRLGHRGIVEMLVEHLNIRNLPFLDGYPTLKDVVKKRNDTIMHGVGAMHHGSEMPEDIIRSVMEFVYSI